MAEYHVGCGAFAIYAGTLNSKNKTLWQNKSECTDEAINAVRDYMIYDSLGGFECKKANKGGYEWTLKDGRVVKLIISIEDAIDELKHLPAADVAPVVHGEWSFAIGYDPRRNVKCSECERMTYEPTNYCPNCGAKMDGGLRDEALE